MGKPYATGASSISPQQRVDSGKDRGTERRGCIKIQAMPAAALCALPAQESKPWRDASPEDPDPAQRGGPFPRATDVKLTSFRRPRIARLGRLRVCRHLPWFRAIVPLSARSSEVASDEHGRAGSHYPRKENAARALEGFITTLTETHLDVFAGGEFGEHSAREICFNLPSAAVDDRGRTLFYHQLFSL
ncbi:hypothetical protein CPLU01_09979 [Colletotrichum plurivorum]|uniref:Uncharacterized protein n=1 Tax=Colletotrichum plurivorum TaxID=2175906 RepID=A0A8H6NA65_9PEZI|nr:hypothetical protein CPLU01_09979 [Colletotrichum plurivorum]